MYNLLVRNPHLDNDFAVNDTMCKGMRVKSYDPTVDDQVLLEGLYLDFGTDDFKTELGSSFNMMNNEYVTQSYNC